VTGWLLGSWRLDMKLTSPLIFLMFVSLFVLVGCGLPEEGANAQTTHIEAPKTDASTVDQAPDVPTGLPWGAECTNSVECQSGRCIEPSGAGALICTRPCTAHTECPTKWMCDIHSGGEGLCIPTCKGQEDCETYKALPFCSVENHCWKKPQPIDTACLRAGTCSP